MQFYAFSISNNFPDDFHYPAMAFHRLDGANNRSCHPTEKPLEKNQTTFVFHFPRRKSSAETIASAENAIVIAQKTPFGPILK